MLCEGASDDGDSSGDHGGSTARVTTVMSASGVKENKDEKSAEEDVCPAISFVVFFDVLQYEER